MNNACGATVLVLRAPVTMLGSATSKASSISGKRVAEHRQIDAAPSLAVLKL